jgi:hypothetical protein
MTRTMATALLSVIALVWTAAAVSHHSIGVINIAAPVWIKGTVLGYRPGAPHATMEIVAKGPAGSAQSWIVEGPFPGRMNRIIALYGGNAETYLKPGDAIEVCGFRPRAQYQVQRSYGDLKVSRERFVHAQLILMPDGQMRSWGPYGKLDNCVRPRDSVATWREFLNRDTLAHDLWCTGLTYTQTTSVAPQGFVDDVNRGLAASCR